MLGLFLAAICIPRVKSLYHNQLKLRFYENGISEFIEENERLKERILQIETEPYYSEKIAREEYGFMKKDEYIFRIENVSH